MAVKPETGTSRANPRFEQPDARRLEVHRDPPVLVGGATPVTTAAEVTDGGWGARDDRQSGHTGADREVGHDGIA